MEKNTGTYWNSYYSKRTRSSVPSQFAAFIINEYSSHQQYIDMGCGNGRDSLFFASHNKNVLGVDGSSEAIKFCQSTADQHDLTSASFTELDFSDKMACEAFISQFKETWRGSLIYARFFLHAIDENAEQNLLHVASEIMDENSPFCLEFRTPRDEYQAKVTAEHFRRYVAPIDFIQTAAAYKLKCTYFVEGYGFAKYKADDAHVARIILEK